MRALSLMDRFGSGLNYGTEAATGGAALVFLGSIPAGRLVAPEAAAVARILAPGLSCFRSLSTEVVRLVFLDEVRLVPAFSASMIEPVMSMLSPLLNAE